MRADDYARLGGHVDRVVPVAEAVARAQAKVLAWDAGNPWPIEPAAAR
jgi:hypothetical protein